MKFRQTDPVAVAFTTRMKEDQSRAIYGLRSQVAEFPHLWIKGEGGQRWKGRELSFVTVYAATSIAGEMRTVGGEREEVDHGASLPRRLRGGLGDGRGTVEGD